MKKHTMIWGFMLAVSLTGCHKEETLVASTDPEAVYHAGTLPQGNHDYDADILQKYRDYTTFFLYKFDLKDYSWGVSADVSYRWTPGQEAKPGYEIIPAAENYVGEQLALLNDLWLQYFPDTLLRRALPHKILLASALDSVVPKITDTEASQVFRASIPAYSGYDYIAVNGGNGTILTLTAAEKNRLKAKWCNLFLARIVKQGLVTRSTDFLAVSNYANASSIPWGQHFQYGFLDWNARGMDTDWDFYVFKITSMPYTELTATGEILDPAVDSRGLIRRKYDIITAYFKEKYNVDLQQIGNDQRQ